MNTLLFLVDDIGSFVISSLTLSLAAVVGIGYAVFKAIKLKPAYRIAISIIVGLIVLYISVFIVLSE